MPSHYVKRTPPDGHPVFSSLDSVEPNGWELLVPAEDKAKRFNFTAERVAQDQAKYDAIVECLGMNMPASVIAKAFHVHHRVVAAIIEREKVSIDALKKDLGELMMKASGLAVKEFIALLVAGKVDAKTASIAAGIFAQNGQLLTGAPTAIIAQEKPAITVEAINSIWERISRLKSAAPAPGQLQAPADAQSIVPEHGGPQ